MAASSTETPPLFTCCCAGPPIVLDNTLRNARVTLAYRPYLIAEIDWVHLWLLREQEILIMGQIVVIQQATSKWG